MEEEQIETTGEVVPVVDLTELETKLTDLVEVLEAEQDQKQAEAEKLAKEEVKAKKLAEEQAKLDAENELLIEEQVQADTATTVEFREDLLVDLKTLNESILELKEIELQNQEMFNNTFPSVKQASDLSIIFLCLIPLFIVYRWIASMFNSAF